MRTITPLDLRENLGLYFSWYISGDIFRQIFHYNFWTVFFSDFSVTLLTIVFLRKFYFSVGFHWLFRQIGLMAMMCILVVSLKHVMNAKCSMCFLIFCIQWTHGNDVFTLVLTPLEFHHSRVYLIVPLSLDIWSST